MQGNNCTALITQKNGRILRPREDQGGYGLLRVRAVGRRGKLEVLYFKSDIMIGTNGGIYRRNGLLVG